MLLWWPWFARHEGGHFAACNPAFQVRPHPPMSLWQKRGLGHSSTGDSWGDTVTPKGTEDFLGEAEGQQPEN